MASLAALKKVGDSLGYDVWYDTYQRLWTCTKDGSETEYFPPAIFSTITPEKFRSILQSNLEQT